MKTAEFKKLAARALDYLPEKIRQKMDNVEIVVERGAPNGPYLGLYEGVPKTAYGRGFGMVLPDKITIFQAPLERIARSNEELDKIVRNVVWHEVAHHFGFSEKGVRELEKKRIKNWSGYVTKHSFALDLEKGVFTWNDPRKIAESLKKSSEASLNRKGTPFQSAMSMLNFYINRAGKNLKPARKRILEQAKIELRKEKEKGARNLFLVCESKKNGS